MSPFIEILLLNILLEIIISFFLAKYMTFKKKNSTKEKPLVICSEEIEIQEKSTHLNALKEKLSAQVIEAEKLNTPRTFALFSKMQRKNNLLQEEINELEDKISKMKAEISKPNLNDSNTDLINTLETKYSLTTKFLKCLLISV